MGGMGSPIVDLKCQKDVLDAKNIKTLKINSKLIKHVIVYIWWQIFSQIVAFTLVSTDTLNDFLQRTILECSLAELIARRKLKESSNEKDSENVEIIEEAVEVARRPYLSKTERNLAESLPESALKEYFKPGEFVHIPMTREEKSFNWPNQKI